MDLRSNDEQRAGTKVYIGVLIIDVDHFAYRIDFNALD